MPALLWILLKKNFKTEVRLILKLVIEIVIILLIFAIVVWNPDISGDTCTLSKEQAEKTTFTDEKAIQTYYERVSTLKLNKLAFTPDKKYSQTIAGNVASALNIPDTIAFESVGKMVDEFDAKTTLAGLVFSSDTEDVPGTLDVAIRFPFKFRTFESKVNRSDDYWLTRKSGVVKPDENIYDVPNDEADMDLYIREGFLQLQHLVFIEWYKLYAEDPMMPKASGVDPENRAGDRTKKASDSTINVASIRYDTEGQCNYSTHSNLVEFLYWFTFLYPFLNLIQKIGRECEENIMVHHINYGCTFMHHYFCHSLVALLHFLILDLVIIIMIKIPWTNDRSSGIFYETGIFFIFFYLLVYNIALIFFVFLIVPWFRCTKHAVYFGLALWLASCGLSTILLMFNSMSSAIFHLSVILFFNNSFPYSMYFMKNREDNQWVLLVRLSENILVVFLVLFFYQYFSPRPNIRRTLCCACFCCGRCKPRARQPKDISTVENTQKVDPLLFEEVSTEGVPFVTVYNVCFNCAANKRNNFLQNISFTAYKGDLTVILGPRNSGKTTLLAVIAGWKYPSKGRVEYMGEEIFKNWKKSRSMADVSMTNNKLFDNLTGKETLRYFICIKRKNTKQKTAMEQNKWLTILQPALPKPEITVRKMTYEQKRLLCLCCTMACDTRIVLIDEPTRYMRATEQRLYWKILREEKTERAIIVATYSIDEAENIADKLIMLNEGTVVANATPFHLKTKSNFYIMTVIKQPNASTSEILKRITAIIPSTRLKNDTGDVVVFELPAGERKAYQLMLLHLEGDAEILGILSIGVSGGDIGEVYMKQGHIMKNQVFSDIDVRTQEKEMKAAVLWFKQFLATLYKKAIYQFATWFPVILLLFCIFIILFVGISSMPLTYILDVEVGEQYSLPPTLLTKGEECKFYDIDVNLRKVCGDKDFKEYIKKETTKLDKVASVVHDKPQNTYTVWIHQQMFHTATKSLNLAHNLILMEDFPDDNTWVVCRNIPFPTDATIAAHIKTSEMTVVHLAVVLGILLPLLVAAFIRLLMAEKLYHVLILQTIAGMRMEVYWIATMLWDLLIYVVFVILFFVIIALTNLTTLSSAISGPYALLLFAYGFTGIAMTYLLSVLLLTTVFGAFMLAFILQLIGFCTYIFFYYAMHKNEILKYIGLIMPTFALLHGLGVSYERATLMAACKDMCTMSTNCREEDMCEWWPECCLDSFYAFEEPGILMCFLSIILIGIICLIILCLIIYWRQVRKFRHKKDLKLYRTVVYSYDDSEVTTIRKKIADADINSCKSMLMVVDQMESEIPKKGNMLNTVSFAVNSYTILGIFGKQRSGKSHIARQLVAEDSVYFGDVYMHGAELKFELKKVYKQLGYCPQDYGLLDALTALQYMRFFCAVRGMPKSDADVVIRNLISALDMKKFVGRRMGKLNVDKRRKVNIAVAFIVYTKVVVLDEPSNGLKSRTRKEIANMVRYAKSSGKVIIVISSDSTEMKMANQVMMVDDGEMLTFGTMNSIFNKNVKGFVLEVQLYKKKNGDSKDEADFLRDADNLNRFVSWLHEDAELHSRNRNVFKYYVPVRQVTYSYLFGTLEKNRGRLNIVEYHVSLGTIDTVMRALVDKRVHRQKK